MKPTHSPQERDRALELYRNHGAAHAARETGIPRGTISAWASRSGDAAVAPETTRAATEMAKLTRDQRKARLAEALLEDAERLREMLWKEISYTRVTQRGETVKVTDLPEPSDMRQLLTSAAIAIDKSQLLAGDATSRSELLSGDDARRQVVGMRDELAERRRKREQERTG